MNLLKSLVPFSEESKQQLVSTQNAVHVFMVKLLVSSAWNAGFFLIVFIFNLIVGVGVSALDGNDALICSYNKPAVTRLVPFLVMYPYASFCIRILSEGSAAVLALWAMLPSFRHATPAAAGME
jgi:hypothetical protein